MLFSDFTRGHILPQRMRVYPRQFLLIFARRMAGEKVFYLKSKVRIYAGSLNKSAFVRYNNIVICCVIGSEITETWLLLKDGNVN